MSTLTAPRLVARTVDRARVSVAERGRWRALDVVRGLAIIAAVAYHFCWDLHDFSLVSTNWSATGTGHLVGRAIAATFLFVVGVSMSLAHRTTLRSASFWRREAKLLACGALVSAVSLVATPKAPVTFGILQDIALSSLLLVPFLRMSRLVALGAALAAYVLPHLVHLESNSRALAWTGLTTQVPPTVDHQPLLPMFGLSLLGLAIGRTVVRHGVEFTWQPSDAISRGLEVLGQHTLKIYLLHQPVIFVLLWLATRH